MPYPRKQDTTVQQPTAKGQLKAPTEREHKVENAHISDQKQKCTTSSEERRISTDRRSTARLWGTERSTTAKVNTKLQHREATHRVVSPGYWRLSGGVRIHCVDDCLPLPLLVDLPKAPSGLSVRGLSLKVLLIFIHIVHLEMLGREGERRRGREKERE